MESFGKITGNTFTLNKDKYNILKARNWNCNIDNLKQDLNFQPNTDLRKGVEKTIKWYKEENWLK